MTPPVPYPAERPWFRTPRGLGTLALLLVGVCIPFLVSDYDLFNATRVLAIALGVAGLNLLVGFSGQISVGHGAIFGIGGYTTMLMMLNLDTPWPLALISSVAVGLLVGVVIGIPALKLGGLNLGLFTIAIAAVFPLLMSRFSDVTGGTVGLALPTSPFTATAGLTSAQLGYLFALAALAGTLGLLRNLTTGRFGRAYAAVRTNRILAMANGVRVPQLKLIAFVISAAVAGFGGGILVLVLTVATPDSYLLTFSLILLMATTVGGNRSWIGAIVGAGIVVYLPDFASDILPGQASGQFAQLIFAVLLAVCLIFAPGGLAGWSSSLARRARGLAVRRAPATQSPAASAHPEPKPESPPALTRKEANR